jgi:hypothetical protein
MHVQTDAREARVVSRESLVSRSLLFTLLRGEFQSVGASRDREHGKDGPSVTLLLFFHFIPSLSAERRDLEMGLALKSSYFAQSSRLEAYMSIEQ